MTNGRPRCIVIGIGNTDRGDDGAGRAVARGLRAPLSLRDHERLRLFSTGLPLPPSPVGEERGEGGAPRADDPRNVSTFSQIAEAITPVASAGSPLPRAPLTPSFSPRSGGRGNAPRQADRPQTTPLGIDIIEHSGEATALIAHMDGAEQLFLIDACVSGASPGTIHRFDVSSAAMPALTSGFSTHGFGLASAVELARALGRLPRRTVVYAIEGTSFETGAPLSPPVATAVPEAIRRLHAEIEGTHAL